MFWQGQLLLTSSRVSSCGVAALSSESFCEPCIVSMFFLVPSRFFLCLWAIFLTWPSALPELSRRTGLVSHFLNVFPGRFGPGELWGPRVWLEPGCRVSLLDTDKVSKGEREKRKVDNDVIWLTWLKKMHAHLFVCLYNVWMHYEHYWGICRRKTPLQLVMERWGNKTG